MVPKQLIEQLETFSDSKLANNLGFTNKSQIAAFAIRGFLKNYSSFMSYLDFLDVTKEKIVLMDHILGKEIHITINQQDQELFCKEDKSQFCNHIMFIEELPRFKESLKKFFKPHVVKIKKYTDEEMVENIKIDISRFLKYYKIKPNTNKKLMKIINELTDKK